MQEHPYFSCVNQLLAMYRCLDLRDYAGVTGTMSEGIAWHRQGKLLQGRQAVRQALQARSPTMRIHHLITNVVATRCDDAQCSLSAYMLVVRHDDGRPLQGPAPLRGLESIRPTHAELVREDGQWLISRIDNDDITFMAGS